MKALTGELESAPDSQIRGSGVKRSHYVELPWQAAA